MIMSMILFKCIWLWFCLSVYDYDLFLWLLILSFFLISFKFYKLLIVMENTIQLNEINEVDLGDDTLIGTLLPDLV